MNNLTGKTTIVVGASRGLGHGIATAFVDAGATVIGVSRSPAALPGSGQQRHHNPPGDRRRQ